MTRKEILEKTIDFDDAIHWIVKLEKEKCELLGLIQAKDKLIEKMKRVKSVQKVGVKTMSQAARRLEILDKVLSLFGMRVGAYQTADMDILGDIVVGVRLTIYFMSSR